MADFLLFFLYYREKNRIMDTKSFLDFLGVSIPWEIHDGFGCFCIYIGFPNCFSDIGLKLQIIATKWPAIVIYLYSIFQINYLANWNLHSQKKLTASLPSEKKPFAPKGIESSCNFVSWESKGTHPPMPPPPKKKGLIKGLLTIIVP